MSMPGDGGGYGVCLNFVLTSTEFTHQRDYAEKSAADADHVEDAA